MRGDLLLAIDIQPHAEFKPMRFPAILALCLLCTLGYAQETSTPLQPAAQKPPDKSNPQAERERSGSDTLLDLPALPESKVTLIGGTVAKLDPVRDRMALRPFGGGQMEIAFDMRTKIYRDGAVAGMRDLRPGNRVYVDTMLNGDQVFAKTIRIDTRTSTGEARGQVVSYNWNGGILSLKERVSPQPFKLHVTPQTAVTIAHHPASVTDIQPGAIVIISFAPGATGVVEARQIDVLANPGQSFTFVGKITFVDLHANRIAIANQSDKETYDLGLDSLLESRTRGLRQGAQATVQAVFDGKQYQARKIELTSPPTQPK
ncbi:MAG: hypothetical protein DMG70_32255 [Acidobacteria bacterium]|nr:MAG: hypothetical protein DMG70_32255 [Acidobacteriota bacterium]